MSERRKEKIRGLMPNYSAFIASSFNRLYLIFLYGTAIERMQAVWDLVPFLPNEVEKDLKLMLDKVKKELAPIGGIKGFDEYHGSVTHEVAREKVSKRWARPLMREIRRLLDERGYLERAQTRYGPSDFPSLDEEE